MNDPQISGFRTRGKINHEDVYNEFSFILQKLNTSFSESINEALKKNERVTVEREYGVRYADTSKHQTDPIHAIPEDVARGRVFHSRGQLVLVSRLVRTIVGEWEDT